MTDPKETAARVRLEAYALRRVLDLDAPDRPEACADRSSTSRSQVTPGNPASRSA